MALRDRNDDAKTPFNQALAGRFRLFVLGQNVLGKLDFFVLRQRWKGATLAEIELDGVVIESRHFQVPIVKLRHRETASWILLIRRVLSRSPSAGSTRLKD